MRLRLFIVLAILALLLVACQANTATPASTETVGSGDQESSHLSEVTDTPQETTPPETATTPPKTPTPTQISAETSGLPGCTVESIRPTPGPTQQSIFPPVTNEDWVTGPQDAYITILEYGDFQ
jgi:hypothetical protein